MTLQTARHDRLPHLSCSTPKQLLYQFGRDAPPFLQLFIVKLPTSSPLPLPTVVCNQFSSFKGVRLQTIPQSHWSANFWFGCLALKDVKRQEHVACVAEIRSASSRIDGYLGGNGQVTEPFWLCSACRLGGTGQTGVTPALIERCSELHRRGYLFGSI